MNGSAVSNPLVASVGAVEWLIMGAVVASLVVAVVLIVRAVTGLLKDVPGDSGLEPSPRARYERPMIPALFVGAACGLASDQIWAAPLGCVTVYVAIESLYRFRRLRTAQ